MCSATTASTSTTAPSTRPRSSSCSLGELLRWGIPTDEVVDVLPAVDRALAWIADYGDADGDGFVEYRRPTDRGLRNQGWKDSFDGVNFAEGRLAEPPIALCEAQGYVYGAYLARAHLAREQGDDATRQRYSGLAADLKSGSTRRSGYPTAAATP